MKANYPMEIKSDIHYYDSSDRYSPRAFGDDLFEMIAEKYRAYPGLTGQLVFLCIGSDRATGDCLGPIVGYKLRQLNMSGCSVYGTLEYPVHARNLEETIEYIEAFHGEPIIIAIDASLGRSSHVGYFTLGRGALKPGAGVDKELPSVGDLYITGIVNMSGFLDHMLLQTTRLHIVMKLADRICEGIARCVGRLAKEDAKETACSLQK